MTLLFDDNCEYEVSASHTRVTLPCNKKDYELVGLYVKIYVEHYLISKFNLTILYVPNKNASPDFSKRDDNQAGIAREIRIGTGRGGRMRVGCEGKG